MINEDDNVLPSVRIFIDPGIIRLYPILRHKDIFWGSEIPRFVGIELQRDVFCDSFCQVEPRATRLVLSHHSIIVVIICEYTGGPFRVPSW